MKETKLVFIPYQDLYNFLNDGIMTREYAILSRLSGIRDIPTIIINKPRTLLDGKRIGKAEGLFPEGSEEGLLREKIGRSTVVYSNRWLDFDELRLRRGWWVNGYLRAERENAEVKALRNGVVYSNNPFAYKLILRMRENGCRIIFDCMDNLCTFPFFKDYERDLAFRGYGEMARYADFFSCNSERTRSFMEGYFGRKPCLIKNGVLPYRPDHKRSAIAPIQRAQTAKSGYRGAVGYVGKIGVKMDLALIDGFCARHPDILFAFVGPGLPKQGKAFESVVRRHPNALWIPGIGSAYVYDMLDQFDALMIPYSVGDKENSGDPLKLYQYMMTGKPILVTPIREVDEFAGKINILPDAAAWDRALDSPELLREKCDYSDIVDSVSWDSRLRPMLEFYRDCFHEA